MLIKSDQDDTFLQSERTDTADYNEVTVTASLGGFVLTVGTWFFESDIFLSGLSHFERTRRGSVSLSSKQFTMNIVASGSAGAARIQFELSRRVEYYGNVSQETASGKVIITGEFTLGGEFIGQMLRDFSVLLESD